MHSLYSRPSGVRVRLRGHRFQSVTQKKKKPFSKAMVSESVQRLMKVY